MPAKGRSRREQEPKAGVIVVAAGQSARMGGLDKIWAPLLGLPLISHSVRVFDDSPLVASIVLVMPPHNVDQGRRLVDAHRWAKVVAVCAGGERRQDSVRRGLDRMPDSKWIMVHDGARPCIDEQTISTGLEEAMETGAAVPAVPVTDTIKSVGRDMKVKRTVSRDGLWAVQTPQVFRADLLAEAHRTVSEDVTDDASMVESIGGKVRICMGSYDNIKVTKPEDIPIAEAIVRSRGRGSGPCGR